MKTAQIFSIVLLFSLIHLSHAQDGFVLNGTLQGFEDSTQLIINPILNNWEVDHENEVVICLIDGKFRITGKVSEPTQYSIRSRPKNYPEAFANATPEDINPTDKEVYNSFMIIHTTMYQQLS